MGLDAQSMIEWISEYECEIRKGAVSDGLRGVLTKVVKHLGYEDHIDLTHLYLFLRITNELRSYVFYQIPYSEWDFVSQKLGYQNQQQPCRWQYPLLPQGSGTMPSSDWHTLNSQLSSELDYMLEFGKFQLFDTIFDAQNNDSLGFLQFNKSQEILQQLKQFVDEEPPQDYPEKAFLLEGRIFKDACHVVFTNLHHASVWIATLIVILYPRKDKEQLCKVCLKRIHDELTKLIFLVRPLVSEKMLHFVYEYRFLDSPIVDARSWALSEVYRIGFSFGYTKVDMKTPLDVRIYPPSVSVPAPPSEHKVAGYTIKFSPSIDSQVFEHAISKLEKLYSIMEQLRIALQKNAIAAIMSRNMSHNIGSHVLARIVTGGIDGWTQGLSVKEIVDKLTVGCLIKQLDEAVAGKQHKEPRHEELCKELISRLQNYRDRYRGRKEDLDRYRPYVTPEQARSLVVWGKDVQILARYLQQRMDFIAQVSTEWPTWSEPTWFMRDMMRWFLSQKHLLDYIARSDGLKAHLYTQSSASDGVKCESTNPPTQGISSEANATAEPAGQPTGAAGTSQEEKLGDIRLHIFMVPEECWDKPCGDGQPQSVHVRKNQIEEHCYNCVSAEQLGCRRHRNGDISRDCHRILLYTPGDGSAQCCLDEDFLVAIPGGVVGQHAFFTILENIIRNAAKHGYAPVKGKEDHLDVVIEVLYDPEEKVAIRNEVGDQAKRIPARLFRIYTNVSPVEGGNPELLERINEILQKGIIKETGEMERANWGHAEMKVAAGYLQRRDILHIGGTGQEITGESSKTMLVLGQEDQGSRAIIRAVKSPIGTLGYEFYVPRPRAVGIVCPEGGTSS